MNRPHLLAAAALGTVLGARYASAAVLCVNPDVVTCEGTIQAAVDRAKPGDIVRIMPGVYYENVEVPSGKDRVQLVGAGATATVIDPAPFADGGVVHAGPGIVIASRGVQVRSLGLHNGRDDAIVVRASDVLVQAVDIRASQKAGIAVDPLASNAQLVGNTITSEESGIVSQAFGTLVRGNVIAAGFAGVLIGASGTRAQIVGNRVVTTSDATAIDVQADGSTVTANDIRYSHDGIVVSGSNPIVERNRVTGTQQVGLRVDCQSCFGGSVSFNAVLDAGGNAIEVLSDEAGMRVNGNVVTRSGRISINGVRIAVTLNRATDVGFASTEPCFEIFGVDNIVSGNTATRCSGAGFLLHGDRTQVERNAALSAFENGFTVDGAAGALSGTRLIGNRATSSAAQGFAVIDRAQLTTLTGNTASGSRLDFCDDGEATAATGNTFGTQSATIGRDCKVAH